MADTAVGTVAKSYRNVQSYNPFLTPNWRFERILKLVDRMPHPGRTTRYDDEYIRAGRSFILRWRSGDDSVRARMIQEEPGIAYAYMIYDQAIGLEPEMQFLIEARLLSNQDYPAIAFALKTEIEVVEWYEKLFFNVRPYLVHHDWILKHVLLPSVDRTDTNDDDEDDEESFMKFTTPPVIKPHLDMTLKFFAYYGGPLLCEFMMSGFKRGNIVRNQDEIGAFIDDTWSHQMRKRSAQAAGVFEVNKYNVMDLFAVHTKLVEIQQNADSSEDKKSSIERHIHAMLTEIPWTVGEDAKEVFEGTLVGDYDLQAAELRDDELMLIAAGQQPVGIQEIPGLIVPAGRAPVDKEVKKNDGTDSK